MNAGAHRSTAAELRTAALAAVAPDAAVQRFIARDGDLLRIRGHEYDLATFERVLLVAAGKAAVAMADATAKLLGERLTEGVVVTKRGHVDRALPSSLRVHEAGHPVPDDASMVAARDIAALVGGATARDLVVCLVSGGASALVTLPADGVSLPDLRAATEALLRSGATIHELNMLRKHLERLKGGGLVRLARGATFLVAVLSDVLGDDLAVIGSGPTVGDPSTFADAWNIVEHYALRTALPASIVRHLERGVAGEIDETAKPGARCFERVRHVIVGNVALAAEAAREKAEHLGFHALVVTTRLEGEARAVAQRIAALVFDVIAHDRPVAKPACLVFGGETTVTVTGSGLGGRSQELALAAAIALDGAPNALVCAFGTDGTDGPTDAAGAMASGETLERARALGLDAESCLANNDSRRFFAALGELVTTGPTGTNVGDLVFALVL
jgi:hydroxypyruvate reductase